MAGPLGTVGVFLVILQPVLLNAWCTLYLASARRGVPEGFVDTGQ